MKSTFVSCLFHVFTKHVGPHLTGRAMDLLPVNSRVFSSSWSHKINGIRQASLNCQFFGRSNIQSKAMVILNNFEGFSLIGHCLGW